MIFPGDVETVIVETAGEFIWRTEEEWHVRVTQGCSAECIFHDIDDIVDIQC